MIWKTLLVHLDAGARRTERLEFAFETAEAHDAHLVGLFALDAPYVPPHVAGIVGQALRDSERENRARAEADARAEFERVASRRGAGRSEWRPARGDALDAICLHARYADVVIAGQPEGDGDRQSLHRGFAGDLLLAAGRPVLFVPYAGRFRRVAERVMVAWNASREASRAVADALPALRLAKHVDVVVFGNLAGHGEVPGADLALYLARHGIKANASAHPGGGLDVGAQILSRAADTGADLIVMGGYGHSRLREYVMGGATRTLVDSMTVPVLMAH